MVLTPKIFKGKIFKIRLGKNVGSNDPIDNNTEYMVKEDRDTIDKRTIRVLRHPGLPEVQQLHKPNNIHLHPMLQRLHTPTQQLPHKTHHHSQKQTNRTPTEQHMPQMPKRLPNLFPINPIQVHQLLQRILQRLQYRPLPTMRRLVYQLPRRQRTMQRVLRVLLLQQHHQNLPKLHGKLPKLQTKDQMRQMHSGIPEE